MIFAGTSAISAKGLANDLANFDTVKYDIITTQCFVAGTLVLTVDGNKPIEEIQAGDLVYSTNPETGESDYKKVVQTFENETEQLVHITVNGETITTTPKHPFYVPQKGWTCAIELKAGDILQMSNGEYVTVEQVQHEILEEPVKVYNFEVVDFHTYYVGKNTILVHNMCIRDDYLDNAEVGTTRVRHYTNSKGLNGIKQSKMLIAGDNNRVYLEMANKKPLSPIEAETYYQIKRGRGKNYVEFDVDSSLLEWVENPRYHRNELTIKGDVQVKNAKYFKRK